MGKYNIELVYGDLSYKVVGILFDVFNELGPGHPEKYYHKALVKAFRKAGIKFVEQLYCKLEYDNEKVGH